MVSGLESKIQGKQWMTFDCFIWVPPVYKKGHDVIEILGEEIGCGIGRARVRQRKEFPCTSQSMFACNCPDCPFSVLLFVLIRLFSSTLIKCVVYRKTAINLYFQERDTN
jgi:hypothetical protein